MSRIVLLSIVCLSILSPSNARAQVSGWEWVSPAPFGTALNAMVFLDGSTLVGAGDNGIIARSSDRGAHWNVVFTSLDIRFIGLQRRSGTLLAIGDAGAVVRSHDGGQSWLRLADAPIDSVRAIAAAAGQSFFIVGTGGVMLRSDDDGDSWQKVDFDASEDLNAVVFRDARNGVCAGAGGLIALSSDGGTNWRHVVSPTEEDLHCVAWNADGTLFLGGEQGVFLRSTDGAASWIVDGAPTRRVTAFAISDSGWGLALGDSCILRYDVTHQTPLARVFSQVDVRAVAFVDSLWLVSGSKGLLTELRRNRRSIYVPWERSWLFPVGSGDFFEISPVRFPSIRLFAAGPGSLVSTDDGSSWTSFGYWFSTPRAALAMPEDTIVDYGSGSDLGRASVNGPRLEGFPVNLSFHDAMFAAVSSDGVVHQGTWRGWNLRSDDGGLRWEICRLNSERIVYLTSFANDTLAFADQGYGRRLLRSIDAGRHWAEFGPVKNIRFRACISPTRITGGSAHRLLRSGRPTAGSRGTRSHRRRSSMGHGDCGRWAGTRCSASPHGTRMTVVRPGTASAALPSRCWLSPTARCSMASTAIIHS